VRLLERRKDRLDTQTVRAGALLDRFVRAYAAAAAPQTEDPHNFGGDGNLRHEVADVRLRRNLDFGWGHRVFQRLR
jgi:hypothetical protein